MNVLLQIRVRSAEVSPRRSRASSVAFTNKPHLLYFRKSVGQNTFPTMLGSGMNGNNAYMHIKVAVVATDGFEETELTEPVKALKLAGATVEVISPQARPIQAFHHLEKTKLIDVDGALGAVSSRDYDALLLPGGALNADALRVQPALVRLIQDFDFEKKPIAAICHAPWELISAGILEGRTLTSYHTIADDVRNAGARWVDDEVVVDDNLVTSRKPDDIPAFNRETIKLFSRTRAVIPAGHDRWMRSAWIQASAP